MNEIRKASFQTHKIRDKKTKIKLEETESSMTNHILKK